MPADRRATSPAARALRRFTLRQKFLEQAGMTAQDRPGLNQETSLAVGLIITTAYQTGCSPRDDRATAFGAAIHHKSESKLKSSLETGHFTSFHSLIKPSSGKPSQTKLLEVVHKITRPRAAAQYPWNRSAQPNTARKMFDASGVPLR
jgi:hypothetical protein